MAAKRSTRGPDEPARTELTMPRSSAEAELSARIDLAEPLRNQLVKEAFESWDAFNVELLAQMFTTRQIANEYHYSGPAPVIRVVRDEGAWLGRSSRRVNPELAVKFDARVASLKSIRERLVVFPAPSEEASAAVSSTPIPAARAAFIVHGHDGEAREAMARLLGTLGIDAIILNEKPNEGRTLLEKIEKHSADVPYAIVLITGDDVGGKPGEEPKPRARQNVILELGYFWGRLGRGHVCALYEPGVELPSDLGGLARVEFDKVGAWKYQVARELRVVWPDVDVNRI